jgi:hypothetical protein
MYDCLVLQASKLVCLVAQLVARMAGVAELGALG